MSTTVVGLILIPVTLFLLGAAGAGIAGAIRFARYMVRSEEAQKSTAASMERIATRLEKFIDETEDELKEHSEDIAVLKWEIQGRPGRVPDAVRP